MTLTEPEAGDLPSSQEMASSIRLIKDNADRIYQWNCTSDNGYLRKQWGEAGLMEFEFADDTASDYESYDAVAADRAAAKLN